MIPNNHATRGLAMLTLAILWVAFLFYGFVVITSP